MQTQVALLPGLAIRHEAFRLYWHFAAERQATYLRRLAGQPRPWTEDEVIAQYKFCNVFRVTDRVTQDLLTQALYSDTASELAPRDRVFRTIVYRFFSEPRTWQYLEERLGPVRASAFDAQALAGALDERVAAGERIYTGAFILCATPAYGFRQKHHNHAALFDELANGAFLDAILRARSLSQMYELLRTLPLVGTFMAYQLAIDINYGPDVDFPEDSFVAAGPGAERGVRKCFEDRGRNSTDEIIKWVSDNQECLARTYGYEAPSLFGRRLQYIDCQGLFCETDKYCRVALPELRSGRRRIKASFAPTGTIREPFLPPKWGLRVPHAGKVFDAALA